MIHGVLKTAAPLTEQQLHALERGFTDRLGSFVSFRVENDEALIGGFVAVIEGLVYDASVKAQLDMLARVIRG